LAKGAFTTGFFFATGLGAGLAAVFFAVTGAFLAGEFFFTTGAAFLVFDAVMDLPEDFAFKAVEDFESLLPFAVAAGVTFFTEVDLEGFAFLAGILDGLVFFCVAITTVFKN
jgi:hypothetical protein